MKLLETINEPAQVRKLARSQLVPLAQELRSFLLDSVSKTGGHLSSNLGTVELTARCILCQHAARPHRGGTWATRPIRTQILTGAGAACHTLPPERRAFYGFPNRDESEYDPVGTAHSSTSISAALGMAQAAKIKGDPLHAIAVIGDGAMTAGMAFEAMNNAGVQEDVNLLVILNDNDMSISPPVGALNRHLARLMSGQFYAAAKNVGKSVLPGPVLELAKRFEEHAKGMVVPATMFEEFGFNYIGPIDGHDLDSLIPTLQNIKQLKGPQFLHGVTKKGRATSWRGGTDPVPLHAEIQSGGRHQAGHGAGQDDVHGSVRPLALRHGRARQAPGWHHSGHARMLGRSSSNSNSRTVISTSGIAEQHSDLRAGLACEGLKPVVAIYSTFLQRAYDQLIHDVALQNLDVTFALDRAGLVGADGATHAGNYDMAFLRCIPNMVVMAASDENECRQMLTTVTIILVLPPLRYPRGAGAGVAIVPD